MATKSNEVGAAHLVKHPSQGMQTSTVARLVLVVEYDELVGASELEELVEKARELGAVVTADVHVLSPSVVDVLR